MQQITDTVWLALSAKQKAVPGDSYDGNGYLIWDGDSGVLIDAGTGRAAQEWLAAVAAVAPLDQLSGVILTHYHLDHAGGAAAAAEAGLPVYASAETARALTQADEATTQVAAARDAGVYPQDYYLPRCPEVCEVSDGDQIGPVRVIAAPGHCDGHLVGLLAEGTGVSLFSGDVVFPGGTVSIQAIPDCRLDRYAQTMQRLATEPVSALFPGHGDSELDARSAHQAVLQAASSFARLVPPPNHIS